MRAFIWLAFPIAPHPQGPVARAREQSKTSVVCSKDWASMLCPTTHRRQIDHLGITKPVDAVNTLGVGYIPLEGTHRNLVAATLGDRPIHEALRRVVRFGGAKPSDADYHIHAWSPHRQQVRKIL